MKKAEWGPIIWTLLHCIACKIKEEHFETEKLHLLKYISGICSNLPCPSCAMHASSIIQKYINTSVKTKSDLIKLILMLHNVVNRKLKKNIIYTMDGLSMYDNKVFRDVLIEYYIMMRTQKYSQKMMLNNFHRDTFLKKFYNYFTDNLSKFLT